MKAQLFAQSAAAIADAFGGKITKVAWIRNADAPMGQPALGRLNCPCGNAPESKLDVSQGDITCACGTVYSYNGWVR